MLARLRGLHRFAAAAFFHAALLLVALLLVLRACVPVEEREPIYSKHLALESYTRTSPADAREIGLEFDRMGEQSSYAFEPWTLFRERAYRSRLLNVDDEGVRRTVGVPADCGAREPLVVWVLGGSTVFGWGMPDDQTIPSHLQALLADAFPERCVQVTNLGHSYYYSSLELAYFTRLLRARSPPDVAVFLDGLNDSFYLPAGRDVPYFAEVADRAWERERERALGAVGDQPWVTFNRSLPVFRLLERFEPPRRSEFELVGRYYSATGDPVVFALEVFRFNHRALHALGSEFGVEVLHCLQPTRLHAFPLGPTRDAVLRFEAELAAGAIDGLLSVTDCLQGVAQPWVDTGHYSDQGCHEVARALARRIGERLGQSG